MIGEYLVILILIIMIAALIHAHFMHSHSTKRKAEPIMNKHEFVQETTARLTYWGQHSKADLDSELRAIEQKLRELDLPKAQEHLQPYIKHTQKVVKHYLENYDSKTAMFTNTENAHNNLVHIHNRLSEVGVTHHIQRQVIEPSLSVQDKQITKEMLDKIIYKLENQMVPKTEVEKIDEMLTSLTR